MPVLSTTGSTLLDHINRLDPDGSVKQVIEAMSQVNDIVEDMPFIEGNLPTGHKDVIRTGIPEPTWRKLYGGVDPSKSETAPITESTGMLESYIEVDCEVANMNANTEDFRFSEVVAHAEGYAQKMARETIYGNTDDTPEGFNGLAMRFNTVDEQVAKNAVNVIDCGGTGSDNTSIWLVGWGPRRVTGIYPKGSKAGMSHEDKGQVTVQLPDGKRYEAYQDHMCQKAGVFVADWRYVVRLANIDVSELKHNPADGGARLYTKLAVALERIQGLDGSCAFYMNRTVRTFLRTQRINEKNVQIGYESVAGKRVMMVDETPARLCDALLNTEARVI